MYRFFLSSRIHTRISLVDCVWNVMAHAQKPDIVFRRNGRVHLNRRGASVRSTTGSRVVRISGSNAGYTTFRGSVKSTGYPLHSPVSPSLPLQYFTVCHHISTGLYHSESTYEFAHLETSFAVMFWSSNLSKQRQALTFSTHVSEAEGPVQRKVGPAANWAAAEKVVEVVRNGWKGWAWKVQGPDRHISTL